MERSGEVRAYCLVVVMHETDAVDVKEDVGDVDGTACDSCRDVFGVQVEAMMVPTVQKDVDVLRP